MAKRKKSGRTQSQAEIRVAAQEKRREAHARLVLARKDDPGFVQQRFDEGGRTLSWTPGSDVDRDMQDAMGRQRAAFIERFGREPGPDDPVFFDPEEDEPTMLTSEKQAALFESMIEAATEAGIDPALVSAWHELGYVVTEENRHLFSAHEVQAWGDAVERAGG